MPESITIAAFVLGSVLLLVALLSGKFKIFGAEISGTAGTPARIAAFVLALVFIGGGIALSLRQPAPNKSQDKVEMKEETPNLPQSSRAPRDNSNSGKSSGAPDIGGLWRDQYGTHYTISQNGSSFEFSSVNPNGMRSWGTGTIHHHSVETVYETSLPSNGRSSVTLSDNGRQMSGLVQDSNLGQYSTTLTR